jgi:N-formylglutamate amidohydrolase
MRLTRITPALALFLAVLRCAAATNEFLHVQRGDLPVLITAPHGGSKSIPGVPKRKGPEGELKNGKFVTSRDSGTLELALAAAKEVERISGRRPYVVAFLAHRQFADVNRPENEGVEHPDAKAAHAAFHAHVREFVDELAQRFPRGALLLDIHGQAASSNTVFRGTQNGTTVMRLVEKQGVAALTGEHGVLARLAARGIEVSPAKPPPNPPENPSYSGGFIVRTYGSHRTNGVDAIQLEFGSWFRADEAKREQTARALADAIKTFYERHLRDVK